MVHFWICEIHICICEVHFECVKSIFGLWDHFWISRYLWDSLHLQVWNFFIYLWKF
jgi:hypothetical protein